MSTQSGLTLLNIDENDLDFDLDDDDDEFLINKNKINNPQKTQPLKRKSPEPLSPMMQKEPKNSCIEINKITDKRDSFEKFEINNQSLLELFDSVDEEKEKNKDIYSSTQLTQTNKSILLSNSVNHSIIENRKIVSPDKLESTNLIDKIYAQNFNHDKIWLFAKESIIDQLTSHNLSQSILEKYSIRNCLNKVI